MNMFLREPIIAFTFSFLSTFHLLVAMLFSGFAIDCMPTSENTSSSTSLDRTSLDGDYMKFSPELPNDMILFAMSIEIFTPND